MTELDFTFTIRRRPTIATRAKRTVLHLTAGAALVSVGAVGAVGLPALTGETSSHILLTHRPPSHFDTLTHLSVPANATSVSI